MPIGRCGLRACAACPPAPGRFSTTTGMCSSSLSFSASRRGNGITAAAGRKAHQNAHRFWQTGTGQPTVRAARPRPCGAHGAGQQAAARGLGYHGMAPADAIKTARRGPQGQACAVANGLRTHLERVRCRPACWWR